MPKRVDMREQNLLGAQGTRRSLNAITYLSLKSVLSLRVFCFFFFYSQTALKWLKPMTWSSFPEWGVSPASQTQEHPFFFSFKVWLFLLVLSHTQWLTTLKGTKSLSVAPEHSMLLRRRRKNADTAESLFSVSPGAKVSYTRRALLLSPSLWSYTLRDNSFFCLGILITRDISVEKQ